MKTITVIKRNGETARWTIGSGRSGSSEQDAVNAIQAHVDELFTEGFNDDGDLPQIATVGSPEGDFFRVYHIPTDNTRDLCDLDIR